jgi:hypothetical protein
VAQASIAASRSVTIAPSRGGHFRVIRRVDGRRINFIVGTGASVIALKPEDAAGIHPAECDYVAPVKTANGVIRVAPVDSAPSRAKTLKQTNQGLELTGRRRFALRTVASFSKVLYGDWRLPKAILSKGGR